MDVHKMIIKSNTETMSLQELSIFTMAGGKFNCSISGLAIDFYLIYIKVPNMNPVSVTQLKGLLTSFPHSEELGG
jgi:hypothetical protein